MTPELKAALARADAAVAAMTPERRAVMWRKQRESWVRGMSARCEHGELDFEQCGDCISEARARIGAHRNQGGHTHD